MLSILSEEINKLEGLIAYHERLRPSVSAASVGWHIDHSLRAIIGMSKALQKSDPAQYRPKLSWSGWWVQKLGWFPRGRGQAPAAVVASKAITQDSLHGLVQAARQVLIACTDLPATSHFNRELSLDFLMTIDELKTNELCNYLYNSKRIFNCHG